MDRIESLTNTISNITLYDIKSMYTQAKNVVLNVSEMEAKVREATNEDPWGASSTLMQDIAQGTFHFQHFNEIMPCIYSRFMEKEARQWRQIYKALQLLEYLIKHGSERVVDDARSHISTLKMLRNFHYIDEKGKDEGINVRNRSRELVELLSDVETIRAERRKAKNNRSKYVGVGNDGLGFGSSNLDSRYGGDNFGSYDGSYSNDYNTGGTSSRRGGSDSFRDNRRQFEEYDAGDDELTHTPAKSSTLHSSVAKSQNPSAAPSQPEVDLLGGIDEAAVSVSDTARNKALPSVDDDDFADFQAAPVQAGQTPHTLQVKNPSLMDMISEPVGSLTPQPYTTGNPGMGSSLTSHRPQMSSSPMPQVVPVSTQAQQPLNLWGDTTSVLKARPMTMGLATITSTAQPATRPAAPATKGSIGFDDLWNLSLGAANSATPVNGVGKSIKDLEKEKVNVGFWGAGPKNVAGNNDRRATTSVVDVQSGSVEDLLL